MVRSMTCSRSPNVDHTWKVDRLRLRCGALGVAFDEDGYDDCFCPEEVLVTVLCRGSTRGCQIREARPSLEGSEPFQNHVVDCGLQAGGEVLRVRVDRGVVVGDIEVLRWDRLRSFAPQKIVSCKLFSRRGEFDAVLGHGAVF